MSGKKNGYENRRNKKLWGERTNLEVMVQTSFLFLSVDKRKREKGEKGNKKKIEFYIFELKFLPSFRTHKKKPSA